MKLYHGTKKEYLGSIKKYGLKRKMNGGDSVYIYTCKTPESARNWGEVILEIDADGLDLRNFPDEAPVWQILIAENVSPQRIKRINREIKKELTEKYIQGDFKCDKCGGKIDFLVEFLKPTHKSMQGWVDFYKDKLCGFKDVSAPTRHGDIYYHGHCFWENKITRLKKKVNSIKF